MVKVFIDGKEGTTGLQIYDRLQKRDDVSLFTLSDECRKDPLARKEKLNEADFVFLCLPDAAAKEAVALVENPSVRIIDASTAHRTQPDWAYGFPELEKSLREKISRSKRVANPGCYASGFLSIVYPLVKEGILPRDYPVTCHAVSGYSGAGKKGIAQYEDEARAEEFDTPRLYATTFSHKHLPEMQKIAGLAEKPVFMPYVCDYYNGMCVTVPLLNRLLKRTMSVITLKKFYQDYYAGSKFLSVSASPAFIAANPYNGTNKMELLIGGNEEQLLISSRFDNLGKGASGAAVQNFNIMLGIDETTSL